MTIEERAELAVETFAAGKGNCTQSVLCAWEDKIPVDHDTLMKLCLLYTSTSCNLFQQDSSSYSKFFSNVTLSASS